MNSLINHFCTCAACKEHRKGIVRRLKDLSEGRVKLHIPAGAYPDIKASLSELDLKKDTPQTKAIVTHLKTRRPSIKHTWANLTLKGISDQKSE